MTPSPKPWEIWIASVRFEDTMDEKERPVIILNSTTVLVFGLYVTSQSPRPEYNDYVLQDWQIEGLKKPSTVRLNRRLSLPKEKLLQKIGSVSQRDRLLISMRGQI